jgi:hypothetical protein
VYSWQCLLMAWISGPGFPARDQGAADGGHGVPAIRLLPG